MRGYFTSVLSAVCVFVGSVSAHAALLAPGGFFLPVPGEPDPVGGAVVASTTVPFSVPGAFSGSVTAQVYAGDFSNPLGGLTFTYKVTNDGVAGPNSIGRVTVDDYTAWVTDVSYQVPVPVGSVAPATADRVVSGDVLGFNFLPLAPPAGFLAPGLSSALLVIQTNAPAFTSGTTFLIDGGTTSVPTFGPIPEPGALALLTAAPLLALRRRGR